MKLTQRKKTLQMFLTLVAVDRKCAHFVYSGEFENQLKLHREVKIMGMIILS